MVDIGTFRSDNKPGRRTLQLNSLALRALRAHGFLFTNVIMHCRPGGTLEIEIDEADFDAISDLQVTEHSDLASYCLLHFSPVAGSGGVE